MSIDGDRTGVAYAAGGGVLAYLLGYVCTYALTISTVRGSALSRLVEAVGGGSVAWKLVGWVFYNAHGVTTTVDVDLPLVGGTSAVNYIGQVDGLSPLLYLLPPALLLAVGIGTARAVGADELGDAVRLGPAVALGYLPPAVVGVFGFAVTAGGSSGQPTLLTGVTLAGVVYPIAFGTVGAALGTALAGGEVAGQSTAGEDGRA